MLGDSYVLEGSNQKADVGIREIEVNKGDWIRVEAKNNGAPTKPSIHVTPIITYVDEAMVEPEQVNRTLLKDTIDYAKSEQEKPEYQYVVPIVKQKLEEALEAAEKVYADENATQAQVEHAFVNLQNAIFNLRLIPNKDKLEELLSKAENIDLSLYTEESGNVLKAAIADAKAIFEDENATEKQVVYASDLLAKAMDGLKTAESKEPTDDKKPSAEQGNAQAGKENASEKKSTAAKTGDTTMMFVWILVMIAGVSTVTVIYKKRKYE